MVLMLVASNICTPISVTDSPIVAFSKLLLKNEEKSFDHTLPTNPLKFLPKYISCIGLS